MKSWDVLDRRTGAVLDVAIYDLEPGRTFVGQSGNIYSALWPDQVAWCRETGAVAYLHPETGEVVYR